MKNIGCIIQARSGSTRLPKKVLMKLPYNSEKTVLEQVINRVQKSNKINDIVLATTNAKEDDIIENIGEKLGVKIYRGAEKNVLKRFYNAAKNNKLDIIIRITSDCPVIDWEILDELIKKHIQDNNDYTSNVLERTYPHGMDAEIFNFSVLEDAFLNSTEQYEKEHVTPYIYKTHPKKFKIGVLKSNYDNDISRLRITLDTQEDYTLICTIYDYLYNEKKIFKTDDIIKLFKEKPWIFNINKKVNQKRVCANLEEEITEALALLEKQDLNKAKKYLEEKYYEAK
ncbi:MAG: acylneuraminate cytidylyltransferase [Fusobacteriia bacterium 4572_132]|nr:MAG: acylneuraminate cytidylyltransferase [Fusobacteriia bacterium 4572_132]